MSALPRALAVALVALLASCGEDSSPTHATVPDAIGSRSTAMLRTASVPVTVAEILANPTAFLGQTVELQGSATEAFPTGELLFRDATGAMPADFSAAGSAPELNVSISMSGTVAAALVAGFSVKIDVQSWAAAPDFNCEDVVDADARFTDPGYTFGNVAGLYLSYSGVPPGVKKLTVFWDVENPAGAVESHVVGEGTPDGQGLFDLEGIVSHEYTDVKGTEEKKVRAELSILGRTGSCARVRDITLTAGSGPGWAGGGTIEVSIDEGSTIESGSTFAVRVKISNPLLEPVDVRVLFKTPDKSSIVEASGDGCRILDEDGVECAVSLAAEERITRVVRYEAPAVDEPIQISGAAALVTGDFAPVVSYRITVEP